MHSITIWSKTAAYYGPYWKSGFTFSGWLNKTTIWKNWKNKRQFNSFLQGLIWDHYHFILIHDGFKAYRSNIVHQGPLILVNIFVQYCYLSVYSLTVVCTCDMYCFCLSLLSNFLHMKKSEYQKFQLQWERLRKMVQKREYGEMGLICTHWILLELAQVPIVCGCKRGKRLTYFCS